MARFGSNPFGVGSMDSAGVSSPQPELSVLSSLTDSKLADCQHVIQYSNSRTVFVAAKNDNRVVELDIHIVSGDPIISRSVQNATSLYRVSGLYWWPFADEVHCTLPVTKTLTSIDTNPNFDIENTRVSDPAYTGAISIQNGVMLGNNRISTFSASSMVGQSTLFDSTRLGPTSGAFSALKTQGNVAYVAAGGDTKFTTVDITDPFSLSVLDSNFDYDFDSKVCLVYGQTAYTAGGSANTAGSGWLSVWDVTDPENLSLDSTVLLASPDSGIRDMAFFYNGTGAPDYIVAVCDGATPGPGSSIVLFDITDLSSPTFVARLEDPDLEDATSVAVIESWPCAVVTCPDHNRVTTVDLTDFTAA